MSKIKALAGPVSGEDSGLPLTVRMDREGLGRFLGSLSSGICPDALIIFPIPNYKEVEVRFPHSSSGETHTFSAPVNMLAAKLLPLEMVMLGRAVFCGCKALKAKPSRIQKLSKHSQYKGS